MPTTSTLKKGELAFGNDGSGRLTLWGNPDGKEVITTPDGHVDFMLQSFRNHGPNGYPRLIMVCNKGQVLSTDEIAFFRHIRAKNTNNLPNAIRRAKSGWIRRDNQYSVDQEGYYPMNVPRTLTVSKLSIAGYVGAGKDVWELLPTDDYDNYGNGKLHDMFKAIMLRVYDSSKARSITNDTMVIRNGRKAKRITGYDPEGISKSVMCGIAVFRGGDMISNIAPFKIVFTKRTLTADYEISPDDIDVTFRI